MICTHTGLNTTRAVLANLEDALLDLTRNKIKYHHATFGVLVEPIETEIRRLRAEIDAYITSTTPFNSPAALPTPDAPPVATS